MADQELPPDVTPPDLTTAWTGNWVPLMDGHVRDQTPPPAGVEPPKEPPVVAWFHISPANLESASKDILGAATEAVRAYTTVKNYMAANKSWVFSVTSPEKLD